MPAQALSMSFPFLTASSFSTPLSHCLGCKTLSPLTWPLVEKSCILSWPCLCVWQDSHAEVLVYGPLRSLRLCKLCVKSRVKRCMSEGHSQIAFTDEEVAMQFCSS